MQHILHTFIQNRNNILNLPEEQSLEQTNTIPPGINNNLMWNAGHVLISQQFLLYQLSDLPMMDFVKDLVPKYGAGTIPKEDASQLEFDLVINKLTSTKDNLIDDFNNGKFKTSLEYTSDYFGVTTQNIEEAIYFNSYHECFHFGFMSAIKLGLR